MALRRKQPEPYKKRQRNKKHDTVVKESAYQRPRRDNPIVKDIGKYDYASGERGLVLAHNDN